MKKLLNISTIILLLLSIAFGNDNSGKIFDYLVKEYAAKYDLNNDDISIKLFHTPDVQLTDHNLQIIDKSESLNLGHNRAKLQILKNGNVQGEYQITFMAKIEILTPVVTTDVKYGEKISPAILKMEKREIRNNYQDYYRNLDIENDLVAKSLIREGDILRKSDIRTKPVINRGQDVDLMVVSGSIMIEMNGIAKENGQKGEKIRVYNQETRRHYFGIVESPQTVVINLD